MLKPSGTSASFALRRVRLASACGFAFALAGCGGSEESPDGEANVTAPTEAKAPALAEPTQAREPAEGDEPSSAEPDAGDPRIRLSWTTKSEDDAEGFWVYRCPTADKFSCVLINEKDPVPAKGTTSDPQDYVYYDLDVQADTDYWYRIGVHDTRRIRGNPVNNWIIGEDAPVKGHSRPLTEQEAEEIRERGIHFRTEAAPEP